MFERVVLWPLTVDINQITWLYYTGLFVSITETWFQVTTTNVEWNISNLIMLYPLLDTTKL